MGVVYAVYDRERREEVALKTLNRVDARNIYMLKREFRALADVAHPNLVTLHELFAEGQLWFFTMELVHGLSFIDYVVDHTLSPFESRGTTLRAPGIVTEEVSTRRGAAPVQLPPTPVRDFERLADVSLQIVSAVDALHAAGKLHRDLKPSNVLVTPEGRARVLDFGLVTEDTNEADSMGENAVVGTPAYMAPEQASGEPALPASDWYALGTMLFEALTGRVPFDGDVHQVLFAKRHTEPLPPSDFAAGVPKALDELCLRLLSLHAQARPETPQIRQALQGCRGSSDSAPRTIHVVGVPSLAAPLSRRSKRFFGRERELDVLTEALAASRSGPIVLWLEGESGSGKSALAQTFLERVRARDGVTLSGRCYQREAVPFRAFDAVVDALSRHLRRVPSSEAAGLLPRGVSALLRIFPVLERVELLADAPRRPVPIEPGEVRSRAFVAFRDLLGRLADRRDTVLHIDDIHWGDADSATLLRELLEGSDAPPILWLASCDPSRKEESELFQRLATSDLGCADERTLRLGRLPDADALDLALDALGGDDHIGRAQAVLRTADGNPFLIEQVARHLAREGRAGRRDFDGVIEAGLEALGPSARRLLELCALASVPLEPAVLGEAAGVGDELRDLLSTLKLDGWLRVSRRRALDSVEIAQEPLRVAIEARVSDDARAVLSRALAKALSKSEAQAADAQLLARLCADAHEPGRAAELWAQAARQAGEALAYEQAVASYQRSLELESDGQRARDARLALSQVFVSMGRIAEASTQLRTAAQTASPEDARTLLEQARRLELKATHLELLLEGSGSGARAFDGFEAGDVEALLGQAAMVERSRGEVVARHGEPADAFLVVLSGEVEVRQGDRVVATFGPGEVLGEVAFLRGAERVVDVYTASERARVLTISRSALERLGERAPRLGLQLVLNLSRLLCDKLLGLRKVALSGLGGAP